MVYTDVDFPDASVAVVLMLGCRSYVSWKQISVSNENGSEGKRKKQNDEQEFGIFPHKLYSAGVFYHFTGSADNPPSLSEPRNSSCFVKKETKAQWPWQKLLQLFRFTSNKLKHFVQGHSKSG